MLLGNFRVPPWCPPCASQVAKRTPLYRIDGAFAAVRKYALGAPDGDWGATLDLEVFVDKGDDIVLALKKADDSFYGVVFASKGSTMLESIYKEAKAAVDKTVKDFDEILTLLRASECPLV